MKDKKKIIIISIISIMIVLMGVLVGVYLSKYRENNNDYSKMVASKNKEKNTKSLTEFQKEIAGLDMKNEEAEEKEESYSDLYKEYLKLSEEEKAKTEVIPRKQNVPFEKLEEIEKKLEENNKTEEPQEEEKIPEKYNLAEKIKIKVENQGSYGLCWDFASIKALETYLALNNLGDYDFSELHLDYIESNLMYGYREVHQGGGFENFQRYVIESGVVLEEEVPYNYYDYKEDEYNQFVDMKKVVEVTETVDFPSMYKSELFEYTDEQIEEFRNTVKKHIMQNGGLYASVVGTNAKNYYAAIDTNEWTNHAVTIVGWDDNYSKNNFLSSDGKRPSKDGAYIALNSWGEFSNNHGYYYISYEDKYVESSLSGIISTSMNNAYKIGAIKNEVIKEHLKENYRHIFVEYQGEEYITKNALASIQSLDLSNSNITSLEGIEIFTNLYHINLSNNNITDVEPLTKLNSITNIDLSHNKITDVSALGDMKTKSLYEIKLANNKIKDVSALGKIQSEGGASLNLDLSNNPNVVGLEKLKNVYHLDISNCNIKSVSNLQNLEELSSLKISNTSGIKGLENLPKNLTSLDISNCNISKLPELKNSIALLNISQNKLTTLDGIQKLENLYELDISENTITNWKSLKELSELQAYQNAEKDIENEEGEGEGGKEISVIARNCNIEDITIFNELDTLIMLDLKDNYIKDVSQFKNKSIRYIDLSNNKDIIGLQSLSEVATIFLNNCNISDIDQILKLEKVLDLSLEYNQLTDITNISQLKELSNLSLAGNKQLSGIISNDNLAILNVSDCNLNDSFDLSKIKNLSYLNISKNDEITDIAKMFENVKFEYMTLIVEEMKLEELEKIRQKDENRHLSVENAVITLEYPLQKNEQKINLKQNKILKRELMKYVVGEITIKNGYLDRNGYIININDINSKNIEIKFEDWNHFFANSTIKIILNSEVVSQEEMIYD